MEEKNKLEVIKYNRSRNKGFIIFIGYFTFFPTNNNIIYNIK